MGPSPKSKVFIRVVTEIIIYTYKQKDMAVCNIFNSLANTTGTFLTFSQYMEDLTKWSVKGSSNRVVPSKYIAAELNTTSQMFDNYTLPKYLMDAFENGCAVYREGQDWNAIKSADLFWGALFNAQLLAISEGTVPGIKYVGDINLQSYNEHDGMGYAEIYCHIPNEAPRKSYQLTSSPIEDPCNFIEMKVSQGDIICGYMDNELNGKEKLNDSYNYRVGESGRLYEFNWDDALNKPKDLIDPSFDINAIIVLYDVYNAEGEVVSQDIPMGMYITGLLENSIIGNSIKKFVSNEDIYNTGTSYGLRICSRFMVSPYHDNYIVKDVTIEDNNYSDLSKVLAKISDSHKKMDDILHSSYVKDQNFKDVLSIFKNARTNVPYIRTINGVNYWFVNGRMINAAVVDNNNCDAYTESELDGFMGINQILSIQVTASSNGATILDKITKNDAEVKVEWIVKYRGKVVDPDTIILKKNGESVPVTSAINTALINISDDTIFEVACTYKGMSVSSSASVKYMYPVYVGAFDNAWNENFGSLDKYLCDGMDGLVNSSFVVNANNQHICIAHPASFGDLEIISDESGYILYSQSCDGDHLGDHVNDFIKETRYVDSEPYYVYTLKNKITLSGDYKLKFN